LPKCQVFIEFDKIEDPLSNPLIKNTFIPGNYQFAGRSYFHPFGTLLAIYPMITPEYALVEDP